MVDSIEQLSFELTANALSEQERALSGLRTYAGTVLGAASIAGVVHRGHGESSSTWHLGDPCCNRVCLVFRERDLGAAAA